MRGKTNLETSSSERAHPLIRSSLHMEITEQLRCMILDGDLPPGGRINEPKLCLEFGVSRTPLREALKVLASEGLVVLLPNRGAEVAPIRAEEVADTFELLAWLERIAGELAASRISDEQLSELEEMHARLTDFHQRGRRSDYFRLNQRIHRQIIKAAGNAVLADNYATLSSRIYRARARANLLQARWDESLQEHDGIMAALRTRDGVQLGERLRDHLLVTGKIVIKALGELQQ